MIKLITHTDMDGSMCAIACFDRFGQGNVDVTFCDYNTIDKEIKDLVKNHENYKYVIAADVFTPDDKLGAAFCELENSYVFDHHKGKRYLNSYDNCVFDEDACAGLITARELGCSDSIIHMAEVVDKMDRMVDDHELFKEALDLNRVHEFIGQEEFVFNREPVAELSEVERTVIVPSIKRQEWESLQEYLKNSKKIYYRGQTGIFFVCSGPTSIIAKTIFDASKKQMTELAFIAAYQPNRQTCSLYASKHNDLDVSEWAKALGGGGHAKASGFPVPHTEVLPFLVRHIFGQKLV